MRKLLTSVVMLSLILTTPVAADTEPPPRPPVYGGFVTVEDGVPVADGVTITAWIGESLVAYSHAAGGQYAFIIPQPRGQDYEGRLISFMIGQRRAQQPAIWHADGGGERNLKLKE